MAPTPLPLAGTRVLDLTQALAGPYASLLLADMGAEVIKVERPPAGDPARQIPPHVEGVSAYFLSVNRNKQSILLDLSLAEGREVFYDLAREADVVLDNYRPGVLQRLGIDYETLARVNPRLISCSISAFGPDGPRAGLPAYDLVVQAMSGLMSITGEPGRPPVRMGLPMGDLGGGLFAVIGIQAALLQRRATGRGQKVDVALLDCLLGMQTYLASTYFATGTEPEPVGSGHHNIVPYQAFRAADSYFVVATFTDAFWVRLCRALNRDDLGADPRFRSNEGRKKHREEIVSILEELFRKKPRAEWLQLLQEAGVPCAPVNSLGEALTDPQVAHREMTMTLQHPQAGSVRLAGAPLKFEETEIPRQPPPQPGDHTRSILRHLAGYGDERIEALYEAEVVS